MFRRSPGTVVLVVSIRRSTIVVVDPEAGTTSRFRMRRRDLSDLLGGKS